MMLPARIRLTYLINDLDKGGAECLIWDVVRTIDKAQFDCRVVYLFGKSAFPDVPGVEFVALNLPTHRVYRRVWPFVRLWNYFRTHPTDILHTHLCHADNLGQAVRLALNIPLLYSTIHNIVEWPRTIPTRQARLEDALLRVPTRIISVGKVLRDQVIATRHCPPERIITLYNGVDLEPFVSARESREAARRELGIPPDALVAICVAQFRQEKRHDLVLESFGRLLVDVPDARLILVGNSGLRQGFVLEWIRQHSLESRVLIRHGDRSTVARLCGAADVFTMHSEHEGFSLALIEAMATGLPVAVPDIPIFKEAVTDGREGLLFPFGDTQAHARAIHRLWKCITDGPLFWKDVAQAARTTFSIRTHVDRLVEMYKNDWQARTTARGRRRLGTD